MARVISLGDLDSEPSFIIEFSNRAGARLRYWFSVKSNLLVRVEDEVRKTTLRFADYQSTEQAGPREPQRLTFKTGDGEDYNSTRFVQHKLSHSSSILHEEMNFDVVGLLRAVAQTMRGRNDSGVCLPAKGLIAIDDKGEIRINDAGF